MPFVSSQYFIDGVVAGSGVVTDDSVGAVGRASVAEGAPVVDGGTDVVGASVAGFSDDGVVGGTPDVAVVTVVVVICAHDTIPTVTYIYDMEC